MSSDISRRAERASARAQSGGARGLRRPAWRSNQNHRHAADLVLLRLGVVRLVQVNVELRSWPRPRRTLSCASATRRSASAISPLSAFNCSSASFCCCRVSCRPVEVLREREPLALADEPRGGLRARHRRARWGSRDRLATGGGGGREAGWAVLPAMMGLGGSGGGFGVRV